MSFLSHRACRRFERQMFGFLAGQLAPNETLRARAHLDSCEACQARVQRWSAWTPALASATPSLSADHAARLTSRIMLGEPDARVSAQPRRDLSRVGTAALAVSAAAMLVALWVRPAATPPAIVTVAQAPVTPIIAPSFENHELVVAQPVALGRVTVTPSRDSRVRLQQTNTASPVVVVETGTADVDVEPLAQGEELRACTELTCVRVIGTRFSLTHGAAGAHDEVTVDHGLVAVSASATPGIEVVLRAGESLQTPWRNPGLVRAAVIAPAPVRSGPDCATVEVIAAHPASVHECLAHAPVAQWMSVADALLAHEQREQAEHVLREIARRFPASAQADSASYTLAVQARDDGEEANARHAFAHYVDAYPRGEFLSDALWQLAQGDVHAGDSVHAAAHLERLLAVTGASSRRAEATFLLAQIDERELDRVEAAQVLYKRVLADPAASAALKQRATERLAELQKP